MEKKLGKITLAKFGFGGYQDQEIGLHVCLDWKTGFINRSRCAPDHALVEYMEACMLGEQNCDRSFAEIVRYCSKILSDAKVDSVEKLIGVPIEVTFKGVGFDSWRVLTEVL